MKNLIINLEKNKSIDSEIDSIMLKLNDFEEPFDGDEIKLLSKYIKAKLNLVNGNLTETEFTKKFNKIVN